MKKTILAGVVLVGSLSLFACDRKEENTTAAEDDSKVVVDRDSVATEYEVTETVVDYDTTTRTKTVDVDAEDENHEDNH